MEKEPMNDMMPNNKERRSIRDISIDRARRTRSTATPPDETPFQPIEPRVTTTPQPRMSRKTKMIIFGVIIVALLAFGIFPTVFSKATITVTPFREAVTLSGTFTAGTGSIPFAVVTESAEERETIAATGEAFVETKAFGEIVIFNDYDANDQRLIKNTRFETPEGLIYRIRDSVVVPGQTTNAEGETVPGSVTAIVYADASGEEYNIGLTDFTVPGFADTPQFDSFFARSKTAMTGGFAGTQKVVSDSEKEAAEGRLEAALSEKLLTAVRSKVNADQIFFDTAYDIDFEPLAQEAADDDSSVVLVLRGTIYASALDRATLAEHIARTTIGNYNNAPVRFDNLEDLTFSAESNVFAAGDTLKTFSFTLTGEGVVVWVFDEARLQEDLAGKPRRNTETILSAYPAIDEADIYVRPLWKRSYPKNPERVIIKESVSQDEA